MAFKSTKDEGEVWQPMKDADGDPKTVATKDDVLDGYYTGCKQVQVKEKMSTLHSIKTDDGEIMKVWGTKMLDDELEKIREGAYIRIQWLGKVPTKHGATLSEKKRTPTDSFHKWEVFVDEDKAPMKSNADNARSELSKPTGGAEDKAKRNTPIEEESDLPFLFNKYDSIF